jgi:hypothetical protein
MAFLDLSHEYEQASPAVSASHEHRPVQLGLAGAPPHLHHAGAAHPLGHLKPHFPARLVDRIPRTGEPVMDSYLAMP